MTRGTYLPLLFLQQTYSLRRKALKTATPNVMQFIGHGDMPHIIKDKIRHH